MNHKSAIENHNVSIVRFAKIFQLVKFSVRRFKQRKIFNSSFTIQKFRIVPRDYLDKIFSQSQIVSILLADYKPVRIFCSIFGGFGIIDNKFRHEQPALPNLFGNENNFVADTLDERNTRRQKTFNFKRRDDFICETIFVVEDSGTIGDLLFIGGREIFKNLTNFINDLLPLRIASEFK